MTELHEARRRESELSRSARHSRRRVLGQLRCALARTQSERRDTQAELETLQHTLAEAGRAARTASAAASPSSRRWCRSSRPAKRPRPRRPRRAAKPRARSMPRRAAGQSRARTSKCATPVCTSASSSSSAGCEETERRLEADAVARAKAGAATSRGRAGSWQPSRPSRRSGRPSSPRDRDASRRAAWRCVASRATRYAASPNDSTICGAGAVRRRRRSTRTASDPAASRSTRPRCACAWKASVEALRRDHDLEPEAAEVAELPRASRRHQRRGAGARPRARAASDGPDQPAGAGRVQRAAGAAHVPRRATRRRAQHPPRSDAGHQGRRPRDPDGVRRGLRRRQPTLHAAVRDAVPRRRRQRSC